MKRSRSIAERLGDIRSTRLWAWIGPVYRRARRVVGFDFLFPRALFPGVPYPYDTQSPCDRDPPPRPDPEAMRREYRERGLDREEDSFVLYRIIGNDLVPRHRKGQSRDNVAWIVENEPALAGCEKRWVLNRIVDPEEEAIIIRLLEAHGQPYLRIPFEWDAYAARPWDLEGIPRPGFKLSGAFEDLRKDLRERALQRLYRHKNNYVINNNGARNAALEEGRGRAKWVLPWDGNCFITASAWKEIVAGVKAAPWNKYFIVPMARIVDNLQLLDPGFRPEAREEPQVLFRRDAGEHFDEAYYYGRRPKIELLWRLGVPGKWDEWVIEPWDLPCPNYSPEAGQWARAGWVVRLSSGNPALERGRLSENQRYLARVEAITAMLDRLDEAAWGPRLRRDRPVFLREYRAPPGTVDAGRGVEENGSLLLRLKLSAEEACDRGFSALPDGRLGGLGLPGKRWVEERYHRTELARLLKDIFILSLACTKFGLAKYGGYAADRVRSSFLDPESAIAPRLDGARGWRDRFLRKGRMAFEAMNGLFYVLDALRLLRAGGMLSEEEQEKLRAYFRKYLEWLLTAPQALAERAASNSRGTFYDLQVGAICGYLGDYLLLRDTLRDSRLRIVQQFDLDGKPLEELKRTNTAHHCCRNVQAWIHLAEQAEACGEDLWSFAGSQGQGLRKAIEWLLRHMGQEWPYRQDDAFDQERLYPIVYAYRARYPLAAVAIADGVPPASRIKPLFSSHDGVRPFWQLDRLPCPVDGAVPLTLS